MRQTSVVRGELGTSENSLRYLLVGLPCNTFRTNSAGIQNCSLSRPGSGNLKYTLIFRG